MKTFAEYQREAARTRGNCQLANGALGLAGEAGEVADHIKKHLFHGHALDSAKVMNELGDVLWYLSALCEAIGVPMSAVAEANVDKLKARYPHGFSEEASRNRKDGDG